MDPIERSRILANLAEIFGEAEDVSPAGQALHILLQRPGIPEPWHPGSALVRFGDSLGERPEFFIDLAVCNASGDPPRSSSEQYVLGGTWRQFSFSFPWPPASGVPTASAAVLAWLRRFREAT